MSKYFTLFIYLIFGNLFFTACQVANNQVGQPLIVLANQVPIMRTPGNDGKVISNLQTGDTLFFTGKISGFTTQRRINNLSYDEPWLEVVSSRQQRGWVYAGFVKFDPTINSSLTEKVLERRLKNIIGARLTARIANHNQRYNQVVTEEDFAKTYWAAKELRDSIELALARKIMPDSSVMPDMYWLGDMLHGFVPQLADDHRSYRLFMDFEAWRLIAQTSQGNNDDVFIALRRSEYADDGIEYPHKSWAIAPNENSNQVSSLLGDGKHFQILQQANEALKKSSLFKPDILSIKAQLIDDITESTNYWQPQNQILKEMDDILNARFSPLFTQEDLIALAKRREEFAAFQTNNINLNLRNSDSL